MTGQSTGFRRRVAITFSIQDLLFAMDRSDKKWRLIREEAWDGPMNMALDEVAAETAGTTGLRTLRVYQWEPSTLSLGYRQKSGTVDWSVCAENGITVTRRPTGGGGIYHDTIGDISYSIIVPASDLPGDLLTSYKELLTPIQIALSKLHIPIEFASKSQPAVYEPACYLRELNPAHDLVVEGKKISGNAQYRQKTVIIQHGSITFQKRPERHLSVFAARNISPEIFTDRVTSISDHTNERRQDVVGVIEDSLAKWSGAGDGQWTDDERHTARTLADEKYGSSTWTERR